MDSNVIRFVVAASIGAMFAVIVAFVQGCGNEARGASVNAVSFPGPDGTTCYIVYDLGKPEGGNCTK